MEEDFFTPFASRVSTMPHIAANVVTYLDIFDVSNCLRTCKVLRSFIANALGDSRHLCKRMDEAVAKEACLRGKWTNTKVASLSLIRDIPVKVMFRVNVFGLDEHIWISSSFGGGAANRLDIYDFNGSRMKGIPTEANLTLTQVLPGGKVLVDDRTEVKLVSCFNGKVGVQLVHKRLSSGSKVWQGWHHASRDCVYDERVITGKGTLTLFDEHQGLPMPISIDAQILNGLYTLHKKVLAFFTSFL